jgi:hypothetical protein
MLLKKIFGPKSEEVRGMNKVKPLYVMTTCGGMEVQLHSFLTSSLHGGECQLHGPGCSFPRGNAPLPTELEATNFGSNSGEGVVLCGREEKCVSVLVDIWKRRPLGRSKCVGKDNIKMDLRTDYMGACGKDSCDSEHRPFLGGCERRRCN